MEIGKRLKEFRERTKMKMPAIALETGITKENLYKWEKGTRPSDLNDFFKLKAFLDKMEMKEDEFRMELEAQKPHTLRLPLNACKPPVYNTDNRVASGTILQVENELELVVERINAPFLGPVEGAIEVTGESMSPTITDGSRIAIRRLTDLKLLDWGKCYYIINRNLTGIVRRVYLCESGIRLVSDHPDQALFPPIERPWGQILSILEIIGVVNKL